LPAFWGTVSVKDMAEDKKIKQQYLDFEEL
jgi:hypothetical protein